MASRLSRSLVAVALAGSLVFSSTAASAAAVQPVQQPNSWAVLAVMSGGAPAATVCGAAAATAAGTAAPGGCVLPVADAVPVAVQTAPPPPVALAAAPSAGISPLVLALIAVAAGVGALLAIHHNGTANSPA